MGIILGRKLADIQLPHKYVALNGHQVIDQNYPGLAPVMFNTTESRDAWLRNWRANGDCSFEFSKPGRPKKNGV